MTTRTHFSAVSLFSGCGGSDLGLQQAGVETIWANEVCESACHLFEDVTRKRVIHQGDIRRIDHFPKADILVGCYPCQGYSQAGRRKSEDSINYLYREFDRALRQIKPLAFIVENVDGMRFAHNRELLDCQLTRFRSAGYRVTWSALNASDFGVPQNRRRLLLVGIRSKEGKLFHFPSATHGDRTVDSKLKSATTLRDAIWHLRKAPAGSFNEEPFHWYYLSRNRRPAWDSQAPCIVAHWRHVPLHPDSPPLVKRGPDHWEFSNKGNARRLSFLECAAIQGFPHPERFLSGSIREKFRAIGNAVPPPLFAAVASELITLLQSRKRRAG